MMKRAADENMSHDSLKGSFDGETDQYVLKGTAEERMGHHVMNGMLGEKLHC